MTALAQKIAGADDLAELGWGVIAPARAKARLHRRAPAVRGWFAVDWYDHIRTRTDDQRLGSCVANATTQAIEILLHKHQGVAVQLDYERLYWAARKLIYDDHADEGLNPEDAALAAIEYGLLPSGTCIARPRGDVAGICAALSSTPLVVCHSVHDGWRPQRLHPDNAQIDELPVQSGAWIPWTNLHATCLVGAASIQGREMFVVRNSWGRLGLEDAGIICSTTSHFLRTMMLPPVQLVIDPDDFKSHTGWKAWAL